ncbi:4698_t:CDS:2, partial [Dentiscutata heterogama]
VQKKTKNQQRVKASRTYSSSDEPSDVEDGDIEISVLGDEEANSIITRLLQAVPERVDTHMSDGVDMNDKQIGSDSDFENDFEVEAIRDHNIMSSEILNSTIEQLKKEIKSDKYSEVEKAHLYTMLSYLCLVEHSRQRVEASIIVAEAARKGKDGNKWWDSDDLVDQFSDAKALFAFDNTTSHHAYAEDALLAKNINLSPNMCFSEDYKDPKLPIGLKEVLHKRGLWHDRMKLLCKGG